LEERLARFAAYHCVQSALDHSHAGVGMGAICLAGSSDVFLIHVERDVEVFFYMERDQRMQSYMFFDGEDQRHGRTFPSALVSRLRWVGKKTACI
jgi:hypothetical protein